MEKIERVLHLPKGVDPRVIFARLKDGILNLILGKVQEAKPDQTEIQQPLNHPKEKLPRVNRTIFA